MEQEVLDLGETIYQETFEYIVCVGNEVSPGEMPEIKATTAA